MNNNLGKYDIEKMTAQEVFDASARHLLTQNFKSMDSDGCRYDGFRNTCCAAGIFIKNYDEKMEYKLWGVLIKDFDQPDNHEELIRRLQFNHDQYEVAQWPERLKVVSKLHNLDSSVVDELIKPKKSFFKRLFNK